MQLLTPEDATLQNEELSHEARWSYYVSAYTMRDPTEGVPFSQMRMPFLKRNLPTRLDQEDEYNRYYRPLEHSDGLIIRICANSYHLLYEPGSCEWSWRPTGPTEEAAEEAAREDAAVKERRKDRFVEKFINNPVWAHGLSKDEVDESNQRFRSWIRGSESEPSGPEAETGEGTGDGDGANADSGPGAGTDADVDANAEVGTGAPTEAMKATATEAPPADGNTDQEKPAEPEDTEMADAAEPALSESKEA